MNRLVRTPVAGPFSLAGAFAVLAIVYACGPSDETPQTPIGSNDGSAGDVSTYGDGSLLDVGATGKDANDAIGDPPKTLTLQPGVNANGDGVWVCGNAADPAGSITMSSGSGATTVLDKYLPASCRSGFGGNS